MSDDVERMFSVRSMPWHKPLTGDRTTVTGDYPQSFAEARVLAGLDWDPIAIPAVERLMTVAEVRDEVRRLVRESAMKTVEETAQALTDLYEKSLRSDREYRRIARSDTRQTLSYQKNSYHIIPNSAFGEIIDSILNAEPGTVRLETGGSLGEGRRVWMLARVNEPVQLPGDGSLTFPFLGLTSDHTGQASCAARLTTVRIVCHAQGTPIQDGDWRGEVQNHASATQPRICAGKEVVVWGLPFCEKVTPEHRYWARDGKTGTPGWIEAKNLRAGAHEIGLPVDMAVEPAPLIDLHAYTWRDWTVSQGHDPRLDDPEWWWLLGYWWGNGTLHYGRNQRVSGFSLSVPDSRPDDLARIVALLRRNGWTGSPKQKPGCKNVTFTDATLGHFLASWYNEPEKTPPAWVERLPLDCQRQLVRGYWDADGNHETTEGAIIGSIGLDGLVVLRRILMRLGIPSSIRKGSVTTTGTMQIQGRTVHVQQNWTIRFWRGIEQLGLTHRFKGRWSLPYITDGYLWSRVKSVSDTGEEKFWPITTRTHDYTTAFGRSHNCGNTFSAAEAEGERTGAVYSFSHRSDWRGRLGEAREALMYARTETQEYVTAMTGLLGVKITPAQEQLFLREFIPEPPDGLITDRVAKNIAEARAAVMGFLAGPTVEGAGVRGTAYGLVQAAGEYLDHVRVARTWESRMNRSLLRAEPLKAKAAKLAREVAVN